MTESDAVEKVRTDSIRRERRSRIGSEQNLDESKGSLFQSFEHFRKARLILRLLIRRERRSRLGSEQNLDESKGSLLSCA